MREALVSVIYQACCLSMDRLHTVVRALVTQYSKGSRKRHYLFHHFTCTPPLTTACLFLLSPMRLWDASPFVLLYLCTFSSNVCMSSPQLSKMHLYLPPAPRKLSLNSYTNIYPLCFHHCTFKQPHLLSPAPPPPCSQHYLIYIIHPISLLSTPHLHPLAFTTVP